MSDAANELPVPPFYDPENARRWSYRPDPQALFEEAGPVASPPCDSGFGHGPSEVSTCS